MGRSQRSGCVKAQAQWLSGWHSERGTAVPPPDQHRTRIVSGPLRSRSGVTRLALPCSLAPVIPPALPLWVCSAPRSAPPRVLCLSQCCIPRHLQQDPAATARVEHNCRSHSRQSHHQTLCPPRWKTTGALPIPRLGPTGARLPCPRSAWLIGRPSPARQQPLPGQVYPYISIHQSA